MPLNVVTNQGRVPGPRVVAPAVVTARARNPRALAVTIPILRVDQTGLQYDLGAGGTMFRFRTGVLRLTLRQEMYVSNALSACARGEWVAHERGHVRDYRAIMARMEPEIRRDPVIRPVLVAPVWHPRARFNAVQRSVQTAVYQIHQRLVAAENRRRDTTAEYARVNRRILARCPGPFYHRVEPRETLSFLALFYYGRSRRWPVIYDANRAVIGRDPDLIHPGQRLLIPRP